MTRAIQLDSEIGRALQSARVELKPIRGRSEQEWARAPRVQCYDKAMVLLADRVVDVIIAALKRVQDLLMTGQPCLNFHLGVTHMGTCKWYVRITWLLNFLWLWLTASSVLQVARPCYA
jgi:hypothetical protein